jgi:hypothetical protein
MKSSLALLFFFAFSTIASAESTKTFTINDLSKLKVSLTKGRLLITTTTEKNIKTTVEKIKFDEQCQDVREMNGSTLEITVGQPSNFFSQAKCEASLKIEIPVGTNLEYELSSGAAEISIEKMSGNFGIKTASGNVLISGDVLKNLSVTTASGNVSALFKKCEGRADLDFLSAGGDVDLELPSTCKIRVSHKSATGDLFNEIGETNDYQVMIKSKSASGNLSITKNKKI